MPEPVSTPSFSSPEPADRGSSRLALGIAVAVVLVLLAGLLLLGSRHHVSGTAAPLPAASYAPQLPLSSIAMSESTSISGGKSTFIDGSVSNTGPSTVTAATVQVFFKGDDPSQPPHMQAVPLSLIRTREPYIDTESLAANPLKPGEHRDFRLIFENLPADWDQQQPELRIVAVTAR